MLSPRRQTPQSLRCRRVVRTGTRRPGNRYSHDPRSLMPDKESQPYRQATVDGGHAKLAGAGKPERKVELS